MPTAKVEKVKTRVKVKVDWDVIKKLKKKYERATVTDFKKVASALKSTIDDGLKNGDVIDAKQLYEMGNILDHVAENIERDIEEREAQERTAEEWRRMEYEYARVSPGRYSMHTIEQLVEYDASKYRECEHRFCINAFMPPRKNAKYCSDTCKKAEAASIQEHKRTSKKYANGTYLPVAAYLSNRESYEQSQYEEHERLFEPTVLAMIQSEKLGEKSPTAERKEQISRSRQIKEQTEQKEAKSGEVTTYKLNDMSTEELAEKFSDTKLNRIIFYVNSRGENGLPQNEL